VIALAPIQLPSNSRLQPHFATIGTGIFQPVYAGNMLYSKSEVSHSNFRSTHVFGESLNIYPFPLTHSELKLKEEIWCVQNALYPRLKTAVPSSDLRKQVPQAGSL
jgi:hypothetical protein